MENFIVSARKYRPASFDTVVGQRSITTTLKNSVKSGHLAHAYLFCGPRGVGKTTCARIFAKTINCYNVTAETEACNECESCKAFNRSGSFNIHELDAASNNSVDDIRTLIEQVRVQPQIGRYSIYIIDEVHMLSQQAFNAFLKTLEEPPAHAIFILATTEKHKIIPTILSRCQIFDFNRIKINDIVEHLKYVAKNEGVEAAGDGLNIIAQKADGALRDALSIFDQIVSFSGNKISYENVIENLNVLDYDYYFRLVDAFKNNDISESLMIYNVILDKGFDGQNFLTGLARHFRDLLVSKDSETIQLLEVGESIREKYMVQSAASSVPFLFRALEILNQSDIGYKGSNNKRLHVEMALVQLCGITGEEFREMKPPVKKDIAEKKKESSQEKKYVEADSVVAKPDVVEAKPVIKEDIKQYTHSIKDVINGKKAEKKPVDEGNSGNKAVEVREDTFSHDDLQMCWQEFAKKYKKEQRKFSLLTTQPVNLNENFTIEFTTASELQKSTFEKELYNEILAYLKDALKNDRIILNVSVTETAAEGKKKLYTDEEKYKHLAEKNPDLNKLRDTFRLDFK